MLTAHRTLAFVAIAAGIAACSDSTGPRTPNATVTVQASSLAATTVTVGTSSWLQFTVPVRIENKGSETLTYPNCAERVDARTATSWTPVWSPICLATAIYGPLEIPPGESREFTFPVQVAVSGPDVSPLPVAPVASVYRFVAFLAPPGTNGHIPEVASNSFTLTVEK